MKKYNISYFRSVLCLLLLLSAVSFCNDSDEPSGFELFVRLRQMQIDAQNAMVREDYVKASKIYKKMAQAEKKNRARSAAYLLKSADCLMQAKKGHRALEEYTLLLEDYQLFVPYEHVVAQLRKLAEWFVVGDGTFLGIRDKETGIKIYELVIREAPSVHVTLADRLRLAELLVEVGRPEEAVLVYQGVLRQDSRNLDVRAELALLLLKLSLKGDGDGSKLRAAEREAKIVIESDPNHKRSKELSKLLRDAGEEEARRLLVQGEFYLKPAHLRPKSARRYMHDVIKKYPDTKASRKAQKLLKNNRHLAELEREEAMKSPFADVSEEPLPPPPSKKDLEEKRKDEAKASAKAEKEREAERKRIAEAKEKAEKELRKAEQEKLKEQAKQQKIKDEENKEREKQLKKEAEEKQRIQDEENKKREKQLKKEAEEKRMAEEKQRVEREKQLKKEAEEKRMAEEKRRAELEEAKKQQEIEQKKLQKAQEELREREEKQRKAFEKEQKKREKQRQKEQAKELKKQREIQRKKQKELEKQRKEEERKQEQLEKQRKEEEARKQIELEKQRKEEERKQKDEEKKTEAKSRGTQPEQEAEIRDENSTNERLIRIQKEKEILLRRIEERKKRLDTPTNEAPAPGEPNALDRGKSQSNGDVKASGLSQAVSRPVNGVQDGRLNAPMARQAGNVAAGK